MTQEISKLAAKYTPYSSKGRSFYMKYDENEEGLTFFFKNGEKQIYVEAVVMDEEMTIKSLVEEVPFIMNSKTIFVDINWVIKQLKNSHSKEAKEEAAFLEDVKEQIIAKIPDAKLGTP